MLKKMIFFADPSGIQSLLCMKDTLSQHRSWLYSCNLFLAPVPEILFCSFKKRYVTLIPFLLPIQSASVDMAPSHQSALFVFQLSIDDFTYYSESYGNKNPFQNVQASISLFYFFICVGFFN